MVRQQVVNLKCIVRSEPQHVQIQMNPSRLNQERIEIDDYEDGVAAVGRPLRIADERGIVCGMEMEPLIAFECRVLPPDAGSAG